jgi:hypothetical protein
MGDKLDLSSIFGVAWRCVVGSKDHIIKTTESSITEESTFDVKGLAYIVRPVNSAEVVGWNGEHPAIILNDHGNGKTIYFSFDLGLALDDENYDVLSKIIIKSIENVHTANTTNRNYPSRIVPVVIKVESKKGDFTS